MGRFAQYRKRGRAVESQSFPAPEEGDWELNLVDDVSVITIVNGDPPATHFQGRWRAAGGGDWSIWSFAPTEVADPLPIAADSGPDDFQIRWSNADASEVSDPSDIKSHSVP